MPPDVSPSLLRPVIPDLDSQETVANERPTSSALPAPPSPTLSARSTSLRNNNANPRSHKSSLALRVPISRHHRPTISTNPETDYPITPHINKSGSNKEPPIFGSLGIEDVADPSPFAATLTPNTLADLIPNNFDKLKELGGTDAVITGLGSDRHRGLSAAATDPNNTHSPDGKGDATSATMEVRKRIYGANVLPAHKSKTLLRLMWLGLRDKVIVLLCIAAIISLALGLYLDFGMTPEPIICSSSDVRECTGPKDDWVEGVAILTAVLVVVLIGSLNDWQNERQFRALDDQKADRSVKVVRDGQKTVINVKDVMVGDIVLFEPGEIIPVDGILIQGHTVACDEAGVTGESDTIKKIPYEKAIEQSAEQLGGSKNDCFLISGSKVLEGVGSYVVIAIGPRSFNGRIIMALRGELDISPLQTKLNALAELIAKLGSVAGLILFAALMIRFFVDLKAAPPRSATIKAIQFTRILIIAVTVIVVTVPKRLHLAFTPALAFSTKHMAKEKLLVRVLGSCEIMANASVVCTNKTGTLTANTMTVVAGSAGVHGKFAVAQDDDRRNVGNVEGKPEGNKRHHEDFAIDIKKLSESLVAPVQGIFNDAITINSTAFEDKDPKTRDSEFIGSKTEAALLTFAKEQGWEDYRSRRAAVEVIQMIPFSSERKCMGVVIKADDRYRVFFKGASEILVGKCKQHVVVTKPEEEKPSLDSKEVPVTEITSVEKENITHTIIFYANQMLRTIALCYRDMPQWPPAGAQLSNENEVGFDDLFEELTLIGIVGIEDPLREGVTQAVADCQRAGVSIRMCTGDNVLTARSIARQCGIFTPGGIIMDGLTFRNLSDQERTEVVPRLQVLARSSPSDKKMLVETLKSLGEIVGVTGGGTNDGPALKTANVGFSMGITGTEVAKEASDIILMDENFASIVSAIMWGRCINDAVRKFLQFRVSANITAVIIAFVSAVASSEESSVLTAVQLLWISIIMKTFAALALATDPAIRKSLDNKPDRRTAPLFNTAMRMQIIGHTTYQTFILLLFHFAGDIIFGFDKSAHTKGQTKQWHSELNTLLFNAFVFCQIFNSINSRRIDSRKNVFAGILSNWYFIGITLFEAGIQTLIIFVGGTAFSVHRLSPRSWGVSLSIGFGSLPLGLLIRCISEAPVARMFERMPIMKTLNVLPDTSPEADNQQSWQNIDASETVRSNPRRFSSRGSSYLSRPAVVRKSRSARLHEADVQLPSLLAMVPTLVMTSIGSGWYPPAGSLSDPAAYNPSKSSDALYSGTPQLHPNTPRADPFYDKYGHF